jgi:uncharacterized membrane protein
MGSAWRRIGPETKSTIWTGAILGVGVMAAFDLIVFHQLLQWHNFYYDTTDFWRVFSDGLFNTFTVTVLVIGGLRVWFQRGRLSEVLSNSPLWVGMLLGAGVFQLTDGVVIHKILRLHQVREAAENNLPYDAAWIGSAIILLTIGWTWLQRLPAEVAVEDEVYAENQRLDRQVGQ